MSVLLQEAKTALDKIINKARVDLYKPIQIAEVLYHARMDGNFNVADLDTYRNPSLQWRNAVTTRLTGKRSTSSARYQHDVWSETAMPPRLLTVLDAENKQNNDAVEQYIYLQYAERMGTISEVIGYVEQTQPEQFQLTALLGLFHTKAGLRRSVDKAYEIVAYALFETVVTTLEARMQISIPTKNSDLRQEFSDLTFALLGLDGDRLARDEPAHVYRVGVTNAADRGLDMWANFGPAIQIKHLTLNNRLANAIVDQVESDRIVIVCRDAEATVIETFTKQIGWGRRVCGLVVESQLVAWYERCLHGPFANRLAIPLLDLLLTEFRAEFPQDVPFAGFLEERGYLHTTPSALWDTRADDTA